MKRVFLVTILAIFATNFSYGQELELTQCTNGKYGYKNSKTGAMVIPCQYDVAWGFQDGLAGVGIAYSGQGGCAGDYKKGFIDKTGKVVIPLKYDYISEWNLYSDKGYFSEEGLAVVSIGVRLGCEYDIYGGKWGFVDKTGREVVPLKYDFAQTFKEGLAVVIQNEKCGFIDKTGKEVIPLKYDGARGFIEGLAIVRLNSKYGFIDKAGKLVIPFRYDHISAFSDGYVVSIGKSGLIDKKGREIIPFKYDEISDFPEGYAAVRIGEYDIGKWGFIDKTGKEVIPLEYDNVALSEYDGSLEFFEGTVAVSQNGKWGVITMNGTVVVPFKYDSQHEAQNAKL